MPTRDAEAAGMPAIKEDADVRLLQVPVEPEFNSRTISYVEEGDEQVCYLLYDETRELLHLPPHIFELLARHCEDHHADRNMATHLVQFSRSQVRARDGAAHRPPWHQLLGCLGARVRFLSAVLGSPEPCVCFLSAPNDEKPSVCFLSALSSPLPAGWRGAAAASACVCAPSVSSLGLHHGQHERATAGAPVD